MFQRGTTSSEAVNKGFRRIPLRYADILFMACLLLLLPQPELKAQNTTEADTAFKKPHSPNKAAIFSAVLPGLGQAYNKKYWKIPIIYAGFGLITYFIISNTDEYRKYDEAYDYVIAGDSGYIDNDYVGKYDEQQLLDGKKYHRRNMELSYIVGGLWYILNIVDASVDAHLFDYDVSEDLTIRVDPVMHIRRPDFRPVTGVKLTVKF